MVARYFLLIASYFLLFARYFLLVVGHFLLVTFWCIVCYDSISKLRKYTTNNVKISLLVALAKSWSTRGAPHHVTGDV